MMPTISPFLHVEVDVIEGLQGAEAFPEAPHRKKAHFRDLLEGEQPDKAARHEYDHHEEDDAEHEEVRIEQPGAYYLVGEAEHDGADDRAEDGADAAEKGHDDHVDRMGHVEDVQGTDVRQPVGVYAAQDADHHAGNGVDRHLAALRIDPRQLRGVLRLLDRLQGIAEFVPVVRKTVRDDEGRHDEEGVVEEGLVMGDGEGDAVAPLEEGDVKGPVEFEHDLARGFREGEGRDAEVGAPELHGVFPDKEGDHAGQEPAHHAWPGKKGTARLRHQERRGIVAYAEIGDGAEVDVAGEPGGEVPRGGEADPEKNHRERPVVVAFEPECGNEEGGQRRRRSKRRASSFDDPLAHDALSASARG